MLTKQELRQLQDIELLEEITKTSRELFKARMDHSGGTLKEKHRLPLLRHYIARMKTVAKENELAAPAKKAAVKAQTEPKAKAAPKAPKAVEKKS